MQIERVDRSVGPDELCIGLTWEKTCFPVDLACNSVVVVLVHERSVEEQTQLLVDSSCSVRRCFDSSEVLDYSYMLSTHLLVERRCSLGAPLGFDIVADYKYSLQLQMYHLVLRGCSWGLPQGCSVVVVGPDY